MKHLASLVFAVASAILLTSCAGSGPVSLQRHALTGFYYLQTEIPEPLEIDLAFMRHNFEATNPIVSNGPHSAAIFVYHWDNATITIKALSHHAMEENEDKSSPYQPPQNVSDSAFIDYAVNYRMKVVFDSAEPLVYNGEKNYGYSCSSRKLENSTFGDFTACVGTLVTAPNKSVIMFEAASEARSKQELANIVKDLAESVTPIHR